MGGRTMHRSMGAHWSMGWSESRTMWAKIVRPWRSRSEKLVRSMGPRWATMGWTIRTARAIRPRTKWKRRPGGSRPSRWRLTTKMTRRTTV